MVPQGSSIMNTQQLTNLTTSINGAGSCEELQSLVSEAFDSINAVKDAIAMELAMVQPLLALLSAPGANLGQIVNWITGLITNVLTPMYKPAITYAAQLAALTAQISALQSAIASAQAKFPSCSISI